MQKFSTKGINILKDLEVDKNSVKGVYNDQPVFELPSKLIQNCSIIKNELVLEFNDSNPDADADFLTEMRLYVHQQAEENDVIEALDKKIRDNIALDDKSDDFLVLLPDLPFAVPRGKYTADLCRRSIKLHGSSYNYNISFKNITKAFLLLMPDKQNVCFVMGFDKPLRQGQTVYKFAIIQFRVDQEVEFELKPEEDTLKRIDPSLEKQMGGKYYEVFSKLFKAVSGINIIIPSEFKTSKDENAIKCSKGAKQGYLFVMSKSLLFIFKPVIHIKFEDIARVEFHRITNTMSNRNFDIEIITKDGQNMLFSDIDKADSDAIMNLFTSNKIMVTTAKEDEVHHEDEYEDESDEDIAEQDEEDEEEDDDFVAKDDEDDDDEDEDEDFDPSKFKKKKKNGKKMEEEYIDDDE